MTNRHKSRNNFLNNLQKSLKIECVCGMINYEKLCRKGLDNDDEKGDNANSQPAKHNCALFYVKSKSAYFSRRIASIFRMDVVRFFLV